MQISETQEGQIHIFLVDLTVMKYEGDIDMILGMGMRDQILNSYPLDLVAKITQKVFKYRLMLYII